MSQRIAAVVVTYNRKYLLIECLKALSVQTRALDKIMVIDNASNDGTLELLKENGYLNNPFIEYIRLSKNTGGAGGFHEGLKRAHQEGFDWIWAMDDDGFPSKECLQQLFETDEDDLFCRGSIVLDKRNDRNLSFGLNFSNKVIHTLEDAIIESKKDLIFGWLNPFNGVLIHKKVFNEIGYPIKEFFIWGDEVEFLLRIKKAGFKIATFVKAKFFHPHNNMKMQTYGFFNLKAKIVYQGEEFRDYLIVRNYAYIVNKYEGRIPLVKHFLKYVGFYLKNFKFIEAMKIAAVVYEGASGKLRGHLRYLN